MKESTPLLSQTKIFQDSLVKERDKVTSERNKYLARFGATAVLYGMTMSHILAQESMQSDDVPLVIAAGVLGGLALTNLAKSIDSQRLNSLMSKTGEKLPPIENNIHVLKKQLITLFENNPQVTEQIFHSPLDLGREEGVSSDIDVIKAGELDIDTDSQNVNISLDRHGSFLQVSYFPDVPKNEYLKGNLGGRVVEFEITWDMVNNRPLYASIDSIVSRPEGFIDHYFHHSPSPSPAQLHHVHYPSKLFLFSSDRTLKTLKSLPIAHIYNDKGYTIEQDSQTTFVARSSGSQVQIYEVGTVTIGDASYVCYGLNTKSKMNCYIKKNSDGKLIRNATVWPSRPVRTH